MNLTPTSPIGIFDSGIGGLTVAKAVTALLPNENVIYFGDTARVPYGIKSETVVRRYAGEITRFLLKQDVKMILIACNTVSATAGKEVEREAGDTAVLNVIDSGTDAALKTGSVEIGVIGTLATIGSGAYEREITARNSAIHVISKACPLLVPLAEEGWTDNEIARQTLSEYLSPFLENSITSLILGCTHYPLFIPAIKDLFQERQITIIDSAESIAASAKERLTGLGLMNSSGTPGRFDCYVSDRPQRFQELAERFLGRRIDRVDIIDLD